VETTETKKSFWKIPLVWIFMIFGSTIGRYVGMMINSNSPASAGMSVAISSIGGAIAGAAAGYFLSNGIDSSTQQGKKRVTAKIVAGLVGFFIYCIVLSAVQRTGR
jgi:hypothetical protein